MSAEKMIQISIDHELCKGVEGCGLCIHVCPRKVYEKSATLTARGVRPPEAVRIEDCNACGICMMYCPDMAITLDKK